jgi:hypothetical protein
MPILMRSTDLEGWNVVVVAVIVVIIGIDVAEGGIMRS